MCWGFNFFFFSFNFFPILSCINSCLARMVRDLYLCPGPREPEGASYT